MIALSRFITVYLLLIIAGFYIHLHADAAVPINKPLVGLPRHLGDWSMTSESEFSQGVLDVLKPTDYVSRYYVGKGGERVGLYVGYHSGGKGTGGIHSPKHCLPGSGWFEASSERTSLEVEGQPLKLVKAIYQKEDSRELFLYWFQARDRSLNDEYSLKLAEISGSLFHSRRDTAFIRVSVPFETDQERALATATAFIRDFHPVIMEYLPG